MQRAALDQPFAKLQSLVTAQAMVQSQADYVALQELTAQKEEAEANLEHLMERWVYLNDLYEQMQDEQNG